MLVLGLEHKVLVSNRRHAVDCQSWLDLIHPASKWMHWATIWRHSGLFTSRAATSASSQVSPILNKSLVRGPLLNPRTSQCSTCWGMRCWSMRIKCPSQRSLLSPNISSMQCCPVLALTSFHTVVWTVSVSISRKSWFWIIWIMN